MDTKLTMSDLKPISIVLYSIIVACFISYAVAETMLVKNFAVFFLFVAVTCLSTCFFFCQKNLKTTSKNLKKSSVKYLDKDIKKVVTLFYTTIKNDLYLVGKDLDQIKQLTKDATTGLTEYFYSISSRIDQQQRLMERLIEKCSNLSLNQMAKQIRMINQFVKEDTGNCIRILQFEDIVSQISDHGSGYLDDVEKYLADLHFKLDALENSKSLDVDISMILNRNSDTTIEISPPCCISTDRTNIVQRNLTAGNIDLF